MATPWRRRVRSVMRDRLGLKATAVFLALLLWAIVRLREPTEDVLPARLVPLLSVGMELADPVPRVQVLVRGNGAELLKLHQSPPVIRRRVPSTAPDVVTLDLVPGNVTLPPGVQARVEEVMPRFVTLRLRRTTRPNAASTIGQDAGAAGVDTALRSAPPPDSQPGMADTIARGGPRVPAARGPDAAALPGTPGTP